MSSVRGLPGLAIAQKVKRFLTLTFVELHEHGVMVGLKTALELVACNQASLFT